MIFYLENDTGRWKKAGPLMLEGNHVRKDQQEQRGDDGDIKSNSESRKSCP